MLTRLGIRNLKRFSEADIELGGAVVLIGANNSGKTTALQALALWEIGIRRWWEKRQGSKSPEQRPGVAINRRDLIAIPMPDANLLWRDMHVRNVEQVLRDGERKQRTTNVRIEITVDGVAEGRCWSCGLEFDYANPESFYCRPLRASDAESQRRIPVPPEARDVSVAFLPPMSGLAAVEPVLEPGRINVLLGEGQTAQVLRNLCYQISSASSEDNRWADLVSHIRDLFGVELYPPLRVAERGEITMEYREPNGTRLDLSSSGRGLQQTLLLLAHLYANPGTVLLLDEPDAHLEILRQRQIYKLITDIAAAQGSQIIAASHSEVVLNEAADRDIVIAFVGRPHRIDDRGSQVAKALKDIGFDDYYQAEQTGWVLYLEGATDLAILQAFAARLEHEAQEYLQRPFVVYVENKPQEVLRHYFGLREAKSDLRAVALFDRLDRALPPELNEIAVSWRKREIENYLCTPEVLLAYACKQSDDLFGQSESRRREEAMRGAIDEVSAALKTLGKNAWSDDVKASDEVLTPLFSNFFKRLGLPDMLRKTDFHVLAHLVPPGKLDNEVREKLDRIVETARAAAPAMGA